MTSASAGRCSPSASRRSCCCSTSRSSTSRCRTSRRTSTRRFSDLQWVIDAYALSLAALLLTAGSLADLLGRRRVFAGGLGALHGGVAAVRPVDEPAAARTRARAAGHRRRGDVRDLAGAAGGRFQGRERGTAFGIWGATTGAAVAIGPLVGGVLTEHVGWQSIFFINVPIGIAAIAVTLATVEESKARRGAARLPGLRDLLRRRCSSSSSRSCAATPRAGAAR